MYVDQQLTLSAVVNNVITPQAETTVATHISDNVIDLAVIPKTIIDNLYFVFQCAVVPVSAGGGTLRVDLVTSAAAGLSTPQTLWSSGIMGNAVIVAWTANSTIWAFKVPAKMLLRYLGATYTIGTAVFTAGTWRAFFTPDAPYGF